MIRTYSGRYGKIIITEYSLPTAMKSIKPFQPDKEVTQLSEKEEERPRQTALRRAVLGRVPACVDRLFGKGMAWYRSGSPS